MWKWDKGAQKWVPAFWNAQKAEGHREAELSLTRREALLPDKCKKSVLSVGSQGTVFHMTPDSGTWERFPSETSFMFQSHEAPQSRAFQTCMGATDHFQLAGPLFCIDEEGVLFQRMGHDIHSFSWVAHIPAPPLQLAKLGAFTGDFSVLLTSTEGQIIEREYGSVVHWNYNTFQWQNHGSPEGVFLTTVLDACSTATYSFFALSWQGEMWEGNLVTKKWRAHGCPFGEKLSQGPGAVMRNAERTVVSIFLRTEFGNLVERQYNAATDAWEWTPHGHPPPAVLLGTPNSLPNEHSVFVSIAGGKVAELRKEESEWNWHIHGRPDSGRVTCDRPAIVNSSVFFLLDDRRLAERKYSGGHWSWNVIDTPGKGGIECEGKTCNRRRPDGYYFLDEDHVQTAVDQRNSNFIYALAFHGPVCRRHALASLQNSIWLLSRSGRLLERSFGSRDWGYLPHTSPGGVRLQSVVTSPGGAVFSVDEQGVLFQRARGETQFWWVPHIKSDVQMTPAVAFMPNKPILFVASEDGRLFQHSFSVTGWQNDGFEWVDLGKPAGVVLTAVVDAGNLRKGSVFVVSLQGQLYEYGIDDQSFVPHGAPGTDVISNSGAAVARSKQDASLFLVTDNGDLVERHWFISAGQWEWLRHGQSPKGPVLSPPIAADNQGHSIFVILSTGRAFERKWDGKHWSWVNHRRPKGFSLVCDRGVALSPSSIFFMAEDNRLAERRLEGGKWEWRLHDVPERGWATVCSPAEEGTCTSALMESGVADSAFAQEAVCSAAGCGAEASLVHAANMASRMAAAAGSDAGRVQGLEQPVKESGRRKKKKNK